MKKEINFDSIKCEILQRTITLYTQIHSLHFQYKHLKTYFEKINSIGTRCIFHLSDDSANADCDSNS